MWQFERTTGALTHNGEPAAHGYSGAGAGKNNPDMEAVHDVGPIPAGEWFIMSLTVGETPHGPYVLHLVPLPGTETFGRSGFLIHGDSLEHPGAASEGCIILDRAIRERIWTSIDRKVKIV